MADRFIVIVDDTGLTYPDCIPVYWTFDLDTRKGQGWRNTEAAHRETGYANRVAQDHVDRYVRSNFRTIVGLDQWA